MKKELKIFFEKVMSCYKDPSSEYHKISGDHWDIFDNDFINLIKEKDSWKKFRRNGLTCMLETGLYSVDRKRMIANRELYQRDYSENEKQDIVKRYHELISLAGFDFVSKSIECEVGDPRRYIHDGIPLNFDDLYHIYASWQISRTFNELKRDPEWILEIGGGYGNLCNKIKKLYPSSKYIALDLPESLVIQMGYLSQASPNLKFFDIDGDICEDVFDVALMPGWMREKIKDINFDLVINMRSLGDI